VLYIRVRAEEPVELDIGNETWNKGIVVYIIGIAFTPHSNALTPRPHSRSCHSNSTLAGLVRK